MKLHGDPWNNRWSSFYGIAWNVSMEFHRKCHNPPWKMSIQKFPWNSTEIGALMFSMEFHGNCPNPPSKYFPWKSMEKFPWNSMEVFHTGRQADHFKQRNGSQGMLFCLLLVF